MHQHPVESHLLALVRAHLFGGTFWFSYSWDLTRRLQTQRLTRDQDVGKALWETVYTTLCYFSLLTDIIT
jgi:phosphatidylinositol 4-phosphatase